MGAEDAWVETKTKEVNAALFKKIDYCSLYSRLQSGAVGPV
jgi:hypothetical protein